jgi:subtilisin-like proprotein convertase family protein
MTSAGAVALAASISVLVAAPSAGATTFNNDAPIIIPTGGIASPYPSSITVSGTAGPITDVNIGLDGLTHTVPNDVSIALQSPSGLAMHILGCIGNGTSKAGQFVTLDDAAASTLPNQGSGADFSGTFKPSMHCNATRSFPAPGPLTTWANPGPAQGGAATFATTFNGLSAIGTWNLYVIDNVDIPGDVPGSIPGGWSLDVKPDVTPPAATPISSATPSAAPTKKCKKKKGKKGAAAAKKGCKKKKKKK